MKVCTVVFGLLVACVSAYAQYQPTHGPILTALQPQYQQQPQQVVTVDSHGRQKRSLLLGGAALLGAGALGAGILGAGALGAGIIGAKAGLIGGALASRAFSGRSYGGGYGGYGYAAPVVYEHAPVVYGGYRSYPAYYVEEDWC